MKGRCMQLRAILALCLAFAVVLAPASLLAQTAAAPEQKAEPAQQKPEAQKPEEQKPEAQGEHKLGEDAARGKVGKELAEASREAAAEEGEQFKQSASVRWLASKTGMNPKTAYWVFVLLNFAILAGVAIFFMKSKLPAAFRARTQAIRQQIEEARAASAEAQARLTGIEERLSRIDAEISAMRANSEAEAKKEEERLRAAAEEDKQRIIAAAQQEITGAARAARQDLKAYAASLAVDLAARSIKVDAPTDRALVHNFAEQFGKDGQ